MPPAPPCPSPPLASGGCEHLGCCTTESCCWAHNLWVLIIYLFFFPVILPSEIPSLATDPPESVSWCLETSLFKTPFPGWISIPNSFVTLFIFYISSYLLSKTMGCFSGCLCPLPAFRSCSVEFAWCSNVLSMNFVGEKVVSLSYSSAILELPP